MLKTNLHTISSTKRMSILSKNRLFSYLSIGKKKVVFESLRNIALLFKENLDHINYFYIVIFNNEAKLISHGQ